MRGTAAALFEGRGRAYCAASGDLQQGQDLVEQRRDLAEDTGQAAAIQQAGHRAQTGSAARRGIVICTAPVTGLLMFVIAGSASYLVTALSLIVSGLVVTQENVVAISLGRP